jgi:hypothetical protein
VERLRRAMPLSLSRKFASLLPQTKKLQHGCDDDDQADDINDLIHVLPLFFNNCLSCVCVAMLLRLLGGGKG